MEHLKNTHDLRLDSWGPYTKKYLGISHIPDMQQGLRFDLSVFPGFYRRRVDPPNVMWESAYHPWEAAPDLSYYSHRHQLEWKDQVYCDISFSKLTSQARLIRAEMVNNTPEPQSLVLHFMAYLNFPSVRPYSTEAIELCEVNLPGGAIWLDALNYQNLEFAIPRPTDNLVYDGYYRAEQRGQDFVNGSGIGQGFGQDQDDRVTYHLKLEKSFAHAQLLLRFRAASSQSVSFVVKGLGIKGQILKLTGNGSFDLARLEIGELASGDYTFELVSLGGAAVELDGFVLAEADDLSQVSFEHKEWKATPQIIDGPVSNSLILKYAQVEGCYGLAWNNSSFEVRQFLHSELDSFMRYNVHHHVHSVFEGDGKGHFTNVFIRPVLLAPGETKITYGLICDGSQSEVEQTLASWAGFEADACELYYNKARAALFKPATLPAGEKYRLSQQLMAATTLTNVVYPVYIKRSYIKHYTPGRWWDSLYTWDSGFIGLGLAAIDQERALDCLNAYVTEPGDTHTAFIHHGSPVPVQHYLFLELWNRSQSRQLLEFFYPRLRQYYLFLSGSLGSSTTRNLKSGLVRTWDYFYNSGGWDDYPPQVYVHQQGLEKSVTPICPTAHCIRVAKILRMAALNLGVEEDAREYETDISRWSQALQNLAWDKEAEYFGYVRHNDQGEPIGILRHPGGQNFNMGLDGVYPLVAGECTLEQQTRLLEYLSSDQHLWTQYGLTAVDQSADYYRHDGYWNGTIWLSHQWFFWKTMLSIGQAEMAHRIALTALELWRRETEVSYRCFEHFLVDNGRGAGWHEFGGLSAPVLNWFEAYYRPGRLTGGLDLWVSHQEWTQDHSSLTANFRNYGPPGQLSTLLVTLNPAYLYSVSWNGQAVAFKELWPGLVEIKLKADREEGQLEVRIKEN
jgi:hypothetical protein